MSSQAIRAGAAFVEITAKDKTAMGLARAQARLKKFAEEQKRLEREANPFFRASVGLRSFAGAMRSISTPLKQIGVAFGMFGAGILTPLVNAAKTFATLGKEMGNADATKLTQSFEELKAVFQAISFLAGAALAKPLIRIMEVMINLGMRVGAFIKQNQGLVIAIAAVGVVVTGLAAAFVTSGIVLGLVASIASGLGVIFAALATPLGATVALVAGLTLVAVAAGGAAALMASQWELAAQAIEIAWIGALESIRSKQMAILSSMLQTTEKVLRALGMVSAANTAKGALAGLETGSSAVRQQTGADLAGRMAKLSAESLARFKAKFGGLALDLGLLRGSSGSRFGVAGTTSAAAAGRVGPGSVQKTDDKKTHELLDRMLKAIGDLEVGGELTFE